VLFTSAEFENERALQDHLEELQARYIGDLVIEVWGREKVTSFPVHAAAQRRQQARLLGAGQDYAGAFTILWALALAHSTDGVPSSARLGDVYRDLEALRPQLDGLQAAKLDV
jgi:hypothetical protein